MAVYCRHWCTSIRLMSSSLNTRITVCASGRCLASAGSAINAIEQKTPLNSSSAAIPSLFLSHDKDVPILPPFRGNLLKANKILKPLSKNVFFVYLFPLLFLYIWFDFSFFFFFLSPLFFHPFLHTCTQLLARDRTSPIESHLCDFL